MLKIENTEVVGFEAASRGMRNPMNSWDRGDTEFHGGVVRFDTCNERWEDNGYTMSLGSNDLDLMTRLRNAGTDHRKFMRMIVVYLDITAPLYWWKEFDTYKVGTTANSTSTMHRIHSKDFSRDDFSTDHMTEGALGALDNMISFLEESRIKFTETKDKKYWYDIIQLLPSSYNQMRTVTLNYENLINMYYARRSHKLDEWHTFCDWIRSLPYASELILIKEEN